MGESLLLPSTKTASHLGQLAWPGPSHKLTNTRAGAEEDDLSMDVRDLSSSAIRSR